MAFIRVGLAGLALIGMASQVSAARNFHAVGGYEGPGGKSVAFELVDDEWNLSDPESSVKTPFHIVVYFDKVRNVPEHADRRFNETIAQGSVNCPTADTIDLWRVDWELIDQPGNPDMWTWAEVNDPTVKVRASALGPVYVDAAKMACRLVPAGDTVDANEMDEDAAMWLDFGFDAKK